MDTGYLKSQAKNALRQGEKWKNFSLCLLIFMVINSIVSVPSVVSQGYELIYEYADFYSSGLDSVVLIFSSPLFSLATTALNYLILPILTYGLYSIALKVQKNQDFELSDLFDGFQNFVNIFIMSLLQGFFVFLWTLLFIIPGIIKGISYSMVYFIMAEEPDIRPMDALKKSEQLMDGYKLDFFLLQLSYIGWVILSVLTLGIVSLYYEPVLYTSYAEFYQKIKKEKYGEENYYGYENTPFDPNLYGGAPYQQPQQQSYPNPNYVQPGYNSPVQTPPQATEQYQPPVQPQAPTYEPMPYENEDNN